MEIEPLKLLAAREIADVLRRFCPRTAWWEDVSSIDDIVNVLASTTPETRIKRRKLNTETFEMEVEYEKTFAITSAGLRNLIRSLGDLESHLALLIFQELTVDEDEAGYYLSLLLPSLETFKIAPTTASLSENGFSTSTIEALLALLPASITDLSVHPLYNRDLGPQTLSNISKSPFSAKLRRLRISNCSIPTTEIHHLEKFTSLSTLNLVSSGLDFSYLKETILKLTELVELSLYSKIRSPDLDVPLRKLLDTIIGNDPNQLALPCLEYLNITNTLFSEPLDPILEKIFNHPARTFIRHFPFPNSYETSELKAQMWKRIVESMPIDRLNAALPWENAQELIPLATSLVEISLDSVVKLDAELNDDSDLDSCVVLTQEKINFLSQHLTNLSALQLWCPVADNVSFSSLSTLTMIRSDPSSIPRHARVTSQHLEFPTSLRSLDISYEYVIDAKTLTPSISPLINLTDLLWNANTFGHDDFLEFMSALPLQLTRLELGSCLDKVRASERRDMTALINLPKLIELDVTDGNLAKVGISLQFAQAPRLRVLRFHGEKPAAHNLLYSLTQFESCKRLLRDLSMSSARGRGIFKGDDPLIDIMFFASVRDFGNLKSLELNKMVVSSDLVLISKDCSLVSYLEVTGLILTDLELQQMMQQLPLLTQFVLYDVDGVSGYKWAQHARLERLDIFLNTFYEPGAGQEDELDAELGLMIEGQDLPLLGEISVWTRSRTTKDERTRSMRGFPLLRRVDARPCSRLVLEDLPILSYASIDFSSEIVGLQIINVPNLTELEVSFDKHCTGLMTDKQGLNVHLPSVETINFSHSREGAVFTDDIVALLQAAPMVKELSIYCEGDTVDLSRLWATSSSLSSIEYLENTHHRPGSGI